MLTSKSYMLPKLVLLNMLALLMMSFEHEEPTRKHAQSNAKPLDPLIETKGLNVAKLDNNHQSSVKKISVAKKRDLQKHEAGQSNPFVIKTRYNANTPMGCCFRGNLY